jgi:hypothetical protein
MWEEEALYYPGVLIRQYFATRYTLPLPQPRQENRCAHQPYHRSRVWMHARLTSAIHEAGAVLTNEPRNLEARLRRVSEEPILQAERMSFNAEHTSGFLCLLCAYAAFGKLGWFPIREINQQHSLSFLREFGECSAHLRLCIIGMSRDHQCIITHHQVILSYTNNLSDSLIERLASILNHIW